MKKYSYDLEGWLVVREGQKDNVLYPDAIDCIKVRDAELARLKEEHGREVEELKSLMGGAEMAVFTSLKKELSALKAEREELLKKTKNCHCMESRTALDAVGLNIEKMQIGKVSLGK